MNTQKVSAVNVMHIVGAVERSTPGGDEPTKTWWTRIGTAFVNRDGSWNLRLDYVPARLHETTMQLRPSLPKEANEEAAADTEKLPAGSRMQLVGAVERPTPGSEEPTKTWWTRIGTAFLNRDGSWNLRFDYLPTRLHETTLQMRPFSPKDAKDAEAAE